MKPPEAESIKIMKMVTELIKHAAEKKSIKSNYFLKNDNFKNAIKKDQGEK